MAKNGRDRANEVRALEPFLNPEERTKLQRLLTGSEAIPGRFAEALRMLAQRYVDDVESSKLRAICLLLADLFDQGWEVSFENRSLRCKPPNLERYTDQSIEDVKSRIRSALQASRRKQLQEPSVRKFIDSMERHKIRGSTRNSIADLVDSGDQLATEFEKIKALPEPERDDALAKVVEPVVEICHAGVKCSETGFLLTDIWRYFRHTWAHEYRPIPGRQLLVLVRNAARPNRPIMGIAMLASPVMRLAARDNWIGWLSDALERKLSAGELDARELAFAMAKRIEVSLDEVRWDDLASAKEIASPSENTVLRLEQRASGAAYARTLELQKHYKESIETGGSVRPLRGAVKSSSDDTDWLTASEDLLFIRKRSEVLSKLLSAKRTFQAAQLLENPEEAVTQLFAARSGRRAIEIAMAEFRKAGLSSQVADVSICGAIAPYNEIIGGKLVALILASEEVNDCYSTRYGNQVSVIASQMAGRAICKPADLRVLTTTSLYGVGSSQYNRLALNAADHAGLHEDLRWNSIGKSKTGGFGTLHLGSETAQALGQMAQSVHNSRRINNRFGEGTSPRLRQIREGLDALGIESDAILHHNTPRLFYACELGAGSREALLGMKIGDVQRAPAKIIAAAWRRRWMSRRIMRPETLAALRGLGPASIQQSLNPNKSDLFSKSEG